MIVPTNTRVMSTVTIKGKYGEVSVIGNSSITEAMCAYLGLVKTETGKDYYFLGGEIKTPPENVTSCQK